MAKIDETPLTELFKLWIEKNPDKLKEPSIDNIVELWANFNTQANTKWKSLNPPGKVRSREW